jgi:hypothetical protein
LGREGREGVIGVGEKGGRRKNYSSSLLLSFLFDSILPLSTLPLSFI